MMVLSKEDMQLLIKCAMLVVAFSIPQIVINILNEREAQQIENELVTDVEDVDLLPVIDEIDPPEIIDEGPIVTEECFIEKDQLDVVSFSYNYGSKYDLGYTLAAIALKESNGGRVNINISDPSGGYYHVTLDKVLRYYRWKNTPYNLNRAMQELVNKPNLAAELAVNELLSWRQRTSYNWMATWASYHAGSRGNTTTRGKDYAADIRQIIAKIKTCKWENSLIVSS